MTMMMLCVYKNAADLSENCQLGFIDFLYS